MKRALILAYDFPPYTSVGALRPHNWYLYLKEFGIEPVVVTRQWNTAKNNALAYVAPSESTYTVQEDDEHGKILKTPYFPNLANKLLLKNGQNKNRIVRKAISAVYEFLQFIAPAGPKYQIYKEAESYLLNNKVDVIIASGDPFILHTYASKLSRKFKTPWIADYRDLWSQDIGIQNKAGFKEWSGVFERKALKTASAVTTVSSYLQHKINSIQHKDIRIISNGFDENVIKGIRDEKKDPSKLVIGFAGSVYEWNPVDRFFELIDGYLATRPELSLEINLYGINFDDKMKALLESRPQLKSVVKIHPRLSYPRLMLELSKSDLLLLFNHYTLIGTKIFDYLGLRKQILFCYTDDAYSNKLKNEYFKFEEIEGLSNQEQEDLITKTRSGYLVKNEEHLIEVLDECFATLNETGSIPCNSVDSDNYSRKKQTEKLAELIHDLTSA
ncbi:MAG: hypothetical protein HKN92_05830 [Chitinophagales bacterium]|nr:hypothetical protein [Chitinophagales bacterium]